MLDLKDFKWRHDVSSWAMYQRHLSIVSYPPLRRRVIENLLEIQSRWPRYFSLDEIPSE